jgi:hypothetical protein
LFGKYRCQPEYSANNISLSIFPAKRTKSLQRKEGNEGKEGGTDFCGVSEACQSVIFTILVKFHLFRKVHTFPVGNEN